MPNEADDTPLRAQVADHVRRLICSGDLQPGDQVPAERELAAEMQVSRDTVRAALGMLVAEGLITEGSRRRGRTVRSYDPLVTLLHRLERGKRRDNPTLALDDWAAGVREQGREPRQVVTVHRETASRDVASWLRLDLAAPVVRRHRMRYVDDKPTQVVDSWFPEDIASARLLGTNRQPLLETGDVVVPGGILAGVGHPQVHVHDEMTARPATAAVSRELDLPAGTAVLRHVRIGYGKGGRPVRVMLTMAAGDRNVFVYEMDL